MVQSEPRQSGVLDGGGNATARMIWGRVPGVRTIPLAQGGEPGECVGISVAHCPSPALPPPSQAGALELPLHSQCVLSMTYGVRTQRRDPARVRWLWLAARHPPRERLWGSPGAVRRGGRA